MAAQLRVLRRRIRSVQQTKKITRAMELIATSRIAKAQARVNAAKPYAEEITKVLSELASTARLDHPLLVERENPRRAAVLVVTSDRGLCGGYNSNVIRRSEELAALLRSEGKEPVLYVIGRKATNFYRFRQRPMAGSWIGFSEQPHYVNAVEAGTALVEAFQAGSDADGVDELHIVYTQFVSMLTQTAVAKRVAPMDVTYEETTGPRPLYEFEPDEDTLLAALLPKYVNTRLFAALLEAAASESAARRRAMKAATDNANDLIRALTREMNQARQAQITQEISEIVGGANALAAAGGVET
ncbi:MAG TPA: F0F1 ATP synthase subunit gamma [Pseudonocardiaceae bacterium]|jgi:F-type H+-transporting ATPase subunit gamma